MNRVVFVINSLGNGGAESMLYKLLQSLDKNTTEYIVISLLPSEKYEERIRDLGIEVFVFNLLNARTWFSSIKKTREIMKYSECVLSWLYLSDLFAFVFGKIFGVKRIGWNLRHGNLEKKHNKKGTLMIAKVNALLSNKVDFILSCSRDAIKIHEDYGYRKNFIRYLPNGFIVDAFKKSQTTRDSLRKELLIKPETKVFITVARWNPQKDYNNLVRSISMANIKEAVFIFIGKNLVPENEELSKLLKENNVKNRIILLGEVENVYEYFSVADFYISSSRGEGFPNVIGEAMLCELTCITTDVGETKDLINDLDLLVEKENSKLLANSIVKANNLSNKQIRERGKKNRSKIISTFDISLISERYEQYFF